MPMLIVTFGITGIAWLSQSLKFIDFIVNKGLSIVKFIYLSALIVPSLLMVTIPVAAFVSIIYAYNKLTNDRELLIFKSAGLNNLTIAKPAIAFATICTLVCYLISLYFLPASYREFKDMQSFIRNNYASVLLQEGVFVSPSKNLTIFIKAKDNLGVFKGLLMHDSKNPDREITMMAQEGYIEEGKDEPTFVLLKGSHQETDLKTGQTSLLYFDKYNLKMDFFQNTATGKRWREPEERYLQELFFSTDSDDFQKPKLLAEGHQRLTWPLINIILSLLAVFPFIQSNFKRRGNLKNIVFVSIFAIGCILAQVALKNFAQKHFIFAALMYFNIGLVIFILSLFLFKYNNFEFENLIEKIKSKFFVRKKRSAT